MNYLNFTDFKSFLNAVQTITNEDLEKAKKLLKTDGKDIKSIADIFVNKNDELFELLPDGSLVKVNLYIATQVIDNYTYDLNNIDIANLYKYHIYQCTTISNMFNSGRKHRYKINNRENGTFHYTFTNNQGAILKINKNQKLNICKNCLKKFLHKKYVSDIDVENFKLEEFYSQNSSFFDNIDVSTLEKGEYAKANIYSKLWDKISTQIKKKRNYTCEKCGYTPKTNYDKRFIHTHHRNGNKRNNEEDNLQVLCIKCHSEVDSFHSRIKKTTDYKDYILQILKELN